MCLFDSIPQFEGYPFNQNIQSWGIFWESLSIHHLSFHMKRFSDSSSSSILITTIITSFVLIQNARTIHHWEWNKDNFKIFSIIKERELISLCFTTMIIIIESGDFGTQKAPFGIFTDFDTMAWSPTILQPLFDPKYVKPISLLLKLKRLLNTQVIKLAISIWFYIKNVAKWIFHIFRFFNFIGVAK